MNVFTILTVAALALVLDAASAQARVHRPIFCWVPESEFPIACEDPDEDEESGVASGTQLRSPVGGLRVR